MESQQRLPKQDRFRRVRIWQETTWYAQCRSSRPSETSRGCAFVVISTIRKYHTHNLDKSALQHNPNRVSTIWPQGSILSYDDPNTFMSPRLHLEGHTSLPRWSRLIDIWTPGHHPADQSWVSYILRAFTQRYRIHTRISSCATGIPSLQEYAESLFF